jgi:ribonuclease HI
MARNVWALAPEEITELISSIQEPSAGAWLAAVFEALPHDDLTRTIVTLWALWHARRKAIHEGIFQSPLSTHHFVERFIADLHMIKPTPKSVSPSISRRVVWLPPPADMVKINVDAATSKNSSIGSIAAVARDANGSFLGASSVVMDGMSDPETLEAMACREGLTLGEDLLLRRVKLATDCLNVVNMINGEGRGSYGHIVQEIKARKTTFGKVDIVHEQRSANVDAHNLARSSLYFQLGRHVWFQAPPDGVNVIVGNV